MPTFGSLTSSLVLHAMCVITKVMAHGAESTGYFSAFWYYMRNDPNNNETRLRNGQSAGEGVDWAVLLSGSFLIPSPYTVLSQDVEGLVKMPCGIKTRLPIYYAAALKAEIVRFTSKFGVGTNSFQTLLPVELIWHVLFGFVSLQGMQMLAKKWTCE